MRVLGLETSSRRGSVALVEDGRVVLSRCHEDPGSHAEALLGMITAAVEAAGWDRRSIDRIGAGIGPGSFTGLRVGLALAQGLALGLGVPLIGVGSLQAMARGCPGDTVRWPIVDARRGEVFCAAYGPAGDELVPPEAVGRHAVRARIEASGLGGVVLGEVARELVPDRRSGSDMDLPDAGWVAVLAGESAPDAGPVRPLYVRAPDAVLPVLPPHPLSNSRQS
jgi:tRNA threonylcarbamoyladenosine biosynthesis protein TsaB